jgi:methyl-accepting chemotaxis protein
MKTTSINQTVMAAFIGLMILFAASVGAGIWVAVDLAGQLRETSLSSKILETHQQADMDHDALRGDVLLAFPSQTPGSVYHIGDVRKELAEHVADFKSSIEANQQMAKNPKFARP